MNKVVVSTVCSTAAAAICAAVLWLKWRKKKPERKPRMQLYCYDNFRSKRCEWLLAELGGLNDVEMISLNPQDPNLEVLAQYKQVHPHCTIPCLAVEGSQPIIESGAICMYLADLYESLGPGNESAAYYSWIVYCVATLDEIMENLFVQWVFTDLKHQNTELINKMVLKFQTFAKYLAKTLNGRDYLCGDRFTAADCVLGYNLWWACAMKDGVLFPHEPAIQEYWLRLSRRSAFQRVMDDGS